MYEVSLLTYVMLSDSWCQMFYLLFSGVSSGRHERPLYLFLRWPKLQPAVSRRGSPLLPAAGPQLRHQVSVIT